MLSIDDLTLTGDDKIKADLHGKNWRIYEEEKQKEQGEESSRELSEMSLRHYHQHQQYEDDFFNEYCKNGEYIDWQRWNNKSYVTPFEAARLTYLVDPIKWKEDKNYFGSFSKEELVEFEHLQTDLERKQDYWTFAQLITELEKIGIEPPLRMVEAVNNQESFNSDGAIEAEKNKPVNNQTIQETKPNKPRKKLKPLERETNDGLLLIYEMVGFYNVQYLDEMKAIKAWGKIISEDFKSDSIKSISPAKTFITLSDETKLTKKDFIEKYRKRFLLD